MKDLSPKERQIMELLWNKGPLFVREMLTLFEDPKPHFNTVSTFVRSLEEKGYVRHNTFGNSHQYVAVISREEFQKKTLKGVICEYFNNSYLNLVSTLVKEEHISVNELKELIQEVENSSDKKSDSGEKA